MAIDIELLLSQIRQLPRGQRLRLLARLAASEAEASETTSGKALDEMAAEQGVRPVESLVDLKSRAWPEEESVEDFLDFRRAEREQDVVRQLASRDAAESK